MFTIFANMIPFSRFQVFIVLRRTKQQQTNRSSIKVCTKHNYTSCCSSELHDFCHTRMGWITLNHLIGKQRICRSSNFRNNLIIDCLNNILDKRNLHNIINWLAHRVQTFPFCLSILFEPNLDNYKSLKLRLVYFTHSISCTCQRHVISDVSQEILYEWH